MFDLSGKVALVTGAGRSVGAEIARVFAGQGAAVAANDLFEDRARGVADRIAAESAVPTLGVAADVTDRNAIDEMVRSVEAELGPVDILVNNAGVPATDRFALKPFAETAPDDWQMWIDLNLFAVMHCTHAVIGGMLDRGAGRIISIVSDAARTGEGYMAAYAAAKGGAAAFMKSVAKEVSARGVTCNCVALGTIEYEADEERLAAHAKRYPARRLGRPEDVAPALAWLASDEASWVTGQIVSVNGGYTMI